MSIKKQVFTTLLIAGISALPMIANAGDLHINNTTDSYVTSWVINPKTHSPDFCSSIFQEITGPRDTDHITPEGIIRMACANDLENCVSQVFLSNNCQGSPIATVIFSMNTGIKYTSDPSKVSGSGFKITISN